MRTRVHAALISILLVASVLLAPLATSVHADESTPAASLPNFLRAELYYPAHSVKLGGNTQFQKALKDGDSVYVVVTIDNTAVTTVTADLSQLGGGSETVLTDVNDYIDVNTGPNLLRQFQSEWFPVSSGASTGTTTVTFTATDSNGVVVTKVVDVVLDQAPPTLSVSSVDRTSTTTLKQFDTLTLSGTIDGSGSDARIYTIRAQEMNTDGSAVLHESYYGFDHPSSPELYLLRSGDFTNVSLRLYTADGAMDFPTDTSNLRYIFTLEDDAGNVTYATSSLVSLAAPPPEPEGPQISNVLFLPGIKGSRLYHEVQVCEGVPGVCDETLWEPYSNVLAEKLVLKDEAERVYAKEGQLIDEVLGTKFYSSFIADMNDAVVSDVFGASWRWKPIAYDWRRSLDDIISKGAAHGNRIYYNEATSTPYIEQSLRELAANSPTGKVTLIAHSNGGLVAKALMQKLGDEETAQLIDKIIFVGVPQSGAPQALGALLFGERESLPGKFHLPNILLTQGTARILAENFPMGYHLAPSARYLADAQDPNHAVIGFSGTQLYEPERNAYGPSIDTVEELDGYLLAQEAGGRTKPASDDLTVPNVLNAGLIDYANSTHEALDAWVPPAGVTLYQIAGWGDNTISGIDFYDEQKLLGATIGYKKQYRPIFVEDGDGVVPVPSALMMSAGESVKRYWVNLTKLDELTDRLYDHGNLFESSELRGFVTQIILNEPSSSEFITDFQPDSAKPKKQLIFQLHSPLTLGLYDASGNFTGLNSDGSVSESIPGAEYGEFGEVKYLIAPAGNEYQLVMLGQSEGTFSLDIQEQTGNTVTSSATIADVPTTASTIAKLTITNGVADASSLQVDTDGNGSTDTTVSVQAGETVNYAPPDAATPSSTTSSGSSSNNKQATTTTALEVVSFVLAPFVPATKLVASVPATLKAVVASVTSLEVATDTNKEQQVEVVFPSLLNSQTASVYNSFEFVSKWLKELLYNTWDRVVNFLSHFSL